MTRQLPLPLPVRVAEGREDFFVAPANALALSLLDAPETWAQGRMLLLGPEGAGKSHLAAIWASERGAVIRAAADLRPETVADLAATGAVVIEDAQHLAGRAASEQALFHLLNLTAAEGGRCLITAPTPPRDWGVALPDLKSRLDATQSVRIAPPDEALLAAVLVKLFADRQLTVPQSLIDWLVLRMERALGTARAVVEALDARALAEGRAITRAMAAEVLDRLQG
ncbi:P-loop NTPase family protein [Rhodobacter capsulatus]|jgi:chromosomal replication initiation ATPase DnaA|uniref:DnaA ATPase domain-containing protein n=2 Tax=Rhodobacter capsulatus TaxID=1061 RepID=UPI0003D3B171|nr:DnaA/Hda family protein [Rhodobacter capsulatus]ETD02546.1 chromosomal replication initiator, DnaA [Rhodobacter capsulatus DE442]ETD78644.1 chromosomal replication initiator, DnaA [Rhodobacter capsulatus R121]ETD85359.1 chromosomal replication initiator, DnaA [Rhodobacter capsulatus B6]ETD91544.1 chromosomal replication initiator, DnaA [Rhodobacter capsulatus YW2]ETE54610.1 chromosomal replication initiator, DnaA [Rhodobacter capsulatus Y262]